MVGKFTFLPTLQNVSVGQFIRNIIIRSVLMAFKNNHYIGNREYIKKTVKIAYNPTKNKSTINMVMYVFLEFLGDK